MKNSPYRNSTNTRYLKALFYEQTSEKSTVLYTLKDEDHEGFPSLYLLYMKREDVTEYEFANAYLDGWGHWVMLTECTWFQPFIQRWRKELELKLAARALRHIQEEAESGSKSSFAANRYLIERGWVEKPSKGRPTKAMVKKEAKTLAENKSQVIEDFQLLQSAEKVH